MQKLRGVPSYLLSSAVILCAVLLAGVQAQDGGHKKTVATVDKVFRVMEKGKREINLGTNKNLIVVMGLTGTGKSTMINFLTGDNDKLIAKEHPYNPGLVIDDGNKKIGNDDHVSKTLYPDLNIDLKTNETLVDCPGFVDSRPYAMEIGASYFTKMVLEFADRVKIIFTIGQNDLANKVTFGLLLHSAVELLTDVPKLNEGIGLVVTKVSIISRSEEEEVKKTLNYLQGIKSQISQLRGTPDEQKRMKELLDAFTDTTNGSKIALFKRPLKPGPLSQDSEMQKNKVNIRQVIFNNTKYVSTKNVQFNYTLTAGTITFIRKNINTELINTGLLESKFISNQLFNSLQNIGDHSTNIYEFYQYLSNLTIQFQEYKEKDWHKGDSLMPTFRDLLDLCSTILKENKMKFSHKTDIRNVIDMHNFFKNFTTDVDSPLELWVSSFTDFIEYLQFVNNWYEMLTFIGTKIQTYETQKNKNVELGQTFLNQNFGAQEQYIDKYFLHITDSQIFKKKIELQNKLKGETYQRDKEGIRIDSFILRDIRFILNVAGRKVECKNGILRVQSNFVSLLGDVIWAEKHLCENASNIHVIEIISFEKLFVDADLNYNKKEVHISIIAPFWEVIGTRKINLDGANGKVHTENITKCATSHGSNGLAGNPGEPGGSFFGVGYQFVNSPHLTVSLRGGAGGRGQDGGAGRDGEHGPYPEIRNTYTMKELAKYISEKKYNLYVKQNDVIGSLVYTGLYYVSKSPTKSMRLENREAGTNGWDGGNGGSGGFGANNGSSLIVSLGPARANIIVIQEKGSEGASGRGGLGGRPGTGKASISVVCFFEGKDLLSKVIGKPFSCDLQENRTGNALLEGNDGMDGVGIEGLKQPMQATQQNVSDIVFRFRVERVKGPCIDTTMCLLFDSLARSNNEIMKNVNLTSVTKEIVEVDYNAKDSDFLQADEYFRGTESLLEKYSKVEDAEKYQSLSFLLERSMVSIRDRLKYLEHGITTSDFKLYVEHGKKHLEKIMDSPGIDLILKINERHDVSIESNINDLWRILNTLHRNNLNILIENIKQNTAKRIEEIDVSKSTEKRNTNATDIIKNIAIDYIKNVALLEFINKLGDLVHVFGDLFCAVAKGISKEADISVEDVEDSNSCQTSSVQQLFNSAKTNLQYFLTDFETTNDNKNILNDVFLSYTNAFLTCESHSTDDTDTSSYGQYEEVGLEPKLEENDFNDPSETEPEDTSPPVISPVPLTKLSEIHECLLGKNQSDLKVKNSIQFINFLNSEESKLEIVVNLTTKFKNNINKILPIMEAANATYFYYESAFNFVEKLRSNFRIPIQVFISYIEKNTQTIHNRNFVMENSTQDGIIANLDNLMKVINEFVEEMKPEEQFGSILSTFEEFCNVVISFLRKVESLSNLQTKTIDYAKYGIQLRNQHFLEEIQILKEVIKRNEILKVYKAILNQYVMSSFPLAQIHLDGVDYKLNYEKGMETHTLYNTTQKIFEQLETAIYGTSSSLRNKKSKILKLAMFSSTKKYSAPFFTWKSVNNKLEIDNFLSGREIIMNADITQSVGKNVIKFQMINLKISLQKKHSQEFSSEMLEKALLDFDVELTHMGNSRYKCDTKYFIVRGESVTFRYSLAQGADQTPVRSNEEYKRMLKKEIKLSPYAVWRMRLISQNDAGFTELNKFKGQINLELEGGASYAEPNSKICSSKLSAFYEEYEPLDIVS